MRIKGKSVILWLCILIALLMYRCWRVWEVNVMSPIQTKGKMRTDNMDTFPTYSEIQLLNDKLTYVYAGYYDDRDEDAVVKITALVPSNITYDFTCTVYYPDQTVAEVTGYAEYLFAASTHFYVKDIFRNGYVVCPVSRDKGRPAYLTVGKQGMSMHKTNVNVWPPSGDKNNLTRCVKPFRKKYKDVTQMIWNIEIGRLFGIDKHIIYTDNQTQQILDVLQTYVKDGYVETRNFSIPHPHTLFKKHIEKRRTWTELTAYHDCMLSQMFSAKYVIFHDYDEVLIPRQHSTIWEMADELFAQTKHDPKPAGGLIFRNVYFPKFKNSTDADIVDFPQKASALKYNIYPLLYTTRYKTNDVGITPKSLVLPQTVDVMFIHYAESFKHQAWVNKVVDDKVAAIQHYRRSKYLFPPTTQDFFMRRFADQLILAVKERLERAENAH